MRRAQALPVMAGTTPEGPRHDPYRMLASAVIRRAWDDFWMNTSARWNGRRRGSLTIHRHAVNLKEAIQAGVFLFETSDPDTELWWALSGTSRAAAMRKKRLDGLMRLARLRNELERLLAKHPHALRDPYYVRKRKLPEAYRPRKNARRYFQHASKSAVVQ